jgi:hypothetical protein
MQQESEQVESKLQTQVASVNKILKKSMNVLRQLYESNVFLEQQLCRSQSELKGLALKVIVWKGFGDRNSSGDHFIIGNYSIR